MTNLNLSLVEQTITINFATYVSEEKGLFEKIMKGINQILSAKAKFHREYGMNIGDLAVRPHLKSDQYCVVCSSTRKHDIMICNPRQYSTFGLVHYSQAVCFKSLHPVKDAVISQLEDIDNKQFLEKLVETADIVKSVGNMIDLFEKTIDAKIGDIIFQVDSLGKPTGLVGMISGISGSWKPNRNTGMLIISVINKRGNLTISTTLQDRNPENWRVVR